jgi:long-subunit acyl-CoA synthetase (AMP-forming)
MIAQKALVAGVAGAFVMVKQSGFEINDDDSVLSYLTLAHIFGRIIEELALAAGAHIGYWRVRFFIDVFAFFLSFFLVLKL